MQPIVIQFGTKQAVFYVNFYPVDPYYPEPPIPLYDAKMDVYENGQFLGAAVSQQEETAAAAIRSLIENELPGFLNPDTAPVW